MDALTSSRMPTAAAITSWRDLTSGQLADLPALPMTEQAWLDAGSMAHSLRVRCDAVTDEPAVGPTALDARKRLALRRFVRLAEIMGYRVVPADGGAA